MLEHVDIAKILPIIGIVFLLFGLYWILTRASSDEEQEEAFTEIMQMTDDPEIIEIADRIARLAKSPDEALPLIIQEAEKMAA